MNNYNFILTVVGLAALGMAWMPSISEKIRVSYAIIYVLAGAVLYGMFTSLPVPDPIRHQVITIRLTELVVIVSIMGTGLKIDQPFRFKTWGVPFRLISITMLLCIAAITGIAHWLLGFDWASAVLLGAILAPTDPVLASDVQVGPPLEVTGKESVRFSLTAEAGMNDGVAFPFTWLAVLLAGATTKGFEVTHWISYYLIYKIAVGVAAGFAVGRFLSFFLFYLPGKKKMTAARDGFVALSATLLVYGLTELLQGYGFIAVFVTAITLRNFEINHKYHRTMHSFTDQIERVLLAVMLIIFGGSLASGILRFLTLPMALAGLAIIFLVRPLAGLAGLIGSKMPFKEKLTISFFGIRGIGSFFYLAFALQHAKFAYAQQIWSLVAFIVLVSIVIHGFTANTIMHKLEESENHHNERVSA